MSKIEVNTVDVQCGSTLTLGSCGKTVALASGASQTGFGRTGTVNWDTTVKTSTFTAVNGKGYFCNTSGGAFEVDLPAGSAGAIVSIQDYNNTFDSNNLTIDPNGSEKINGGSAGETLVLSTEGQGLTLVYVDSTVGWRSVHSDDFAEVPQTPAYITATGGTITTSGDYKIHTFTGPGTFCISAGAGPLSKLDYVVVAAGGGGGGGAGGSWAGGGAGAGGYRESYSSPVSGSYTASPLASSTPLGPFTAQAIPVTIGAGGAGSSCTGSTPGTQGSTTTFSTISSAGGGGGGASACSGSDGGNGGSGGGGGSTGQPGGLNGGSGNTPPVSPSQGNDGGDSTPSHTPAAGGGGAGGVGTNSTPGSGNPRAGGAGVASSITASPVTRAVGGASGNHPAPSTVANGGANTGTGGQGHGGAGPSGPRTGGTGGSGIVIIRYKFQ